MRVEDRSREQRDSSLATRETAASEGAGAGGAAFNRDGAGAAASEGAFEPAVLLSGVRRSFVESPQGGWRRSFVESPQGGGRRSLMESPQGGMLHALRDLSISAAEREVLAVVGPSGCGKSTLLELICGLQEPDEGSLSCLPAALMPQRDMLLGWMGALDNAALALRLSGSSRQQARALAEPLFAEMGLSGFEQARPGQLSGGMRQRVAFLRTLLSGKQVLCLDEPFGALDALTRMQMQSWLSKALERSPRTVVLVTHDVEEAILLSDRVAVMSPRPGSVVAEIDVPLPRPRSRTDTSVTELRERALTVLGGDW